MNLLFSILGLVAALIAAGFLYQMPRRHCDRRRYASEGRWIDIGGRRRLYLVEKGSGDPTVLFEAGIAATNLNWFHIQETVSRFTARLPTIAADWAGAAPAAPRARPRKSPRNCIKCCRKPASSRPTFWWDIPLAGW